MTPTQREIGVAVLTAALTLGGSYWQFQAESDRTDAAKMETVFARINTLEQITNKQHLQITQLSVDNANLSAENKQLKLKVGLLESQLHYGDGSRISAVFNLLDALDVPAWCKVWVPSVDDNGLPTGDGHFEMAHINARFEFIYRISAERYIGRQDDEIFSKKRAEQYAESDKETFFKRQWAEYSEPVTGPEGELVYRNFWKFYHRVDSGPELVCGWQVEGNP